MTTVAEFHRDFATFHQQVSNLLQDRESTLDDGDIASRLSAQQRALTENAGALPAYDIRRYQSSLDELSRLLSTRRTEAKPKAKFSFKSRRSEAPKLPRPRDPTKIEEASTLPRLPEPPGSLTINGETAQTSRLNTETHPSLLHNSTITIASFTDSEIDLSRSELYTSVTLRNLTRCSIKAGSSTSSLFIDSCKSCQIIGEAQQFRIHTCSDCQVKYVCRTGRPVIEDCKNMQFGNENKNGAGQRMITVVDDFSDLSGDGRNWSVIDGYVSVSG
ncbi:protein of unknown function [Taphrina deformans PYCC 5710]|uniref:C-CAP/cofactor C-like domain-containing protein n=1 Tax=Taphrina deformans (strain PYCC 5710 / ATCC 11124 / CBS 356.35 / IMI 108563 / JCM 9778 / NBRC 8474) TaxID=1097556 RepID=R4XDT2_TAPDE|nr:protein of unknown function [Taphrina deformans PYCC 5710]|eukprot:CCG83990.1 protein of unknown function [Taphrina deformans PYCC 5710]